MKFVHVIRNVIKNLYAPQVVRNQEDLMRRAVRDGVDGKFIRHYIVSLSNSPTGRRSVEIRANFVKGQGFMLDGQEVPEWVADLHEKVVDDLAALDRFAVVIEMTAGGGIAKLRHVPAEQVSYGIPDVEREIRYAVVDPHFMQEGWYPETKRYQYYPLWSNDRAEQLSGIAYANEQLGGYRGHIYFYNRTSIANRLYSRPILASAENWLETDYRSGEFHASNLRNGLFPGGVLNVVGDKDADIDGVSAEDRLSNQLSAKTTGSENAGNVVIFWRRSGEDATTFESFAATDNHELFTAIAEETRINIGPIGTGVPLILMGLPTAGKLGDTQEIRNAFQLYNQATLSERQVLTQFYKAVLPLAGVDLETYDILPLLPPTDLPESVVNLMNAESLAEYLRNAYGVNIQVEDVQQQDLAPDEPQEV